MAPAEGPSGSESPTEEMVQAPDSNGPRLDDGADKLPAGGDHRAAGDRGGPDRRLRPLSEIDIEDYEGTLVFNVDVGSHDVKVDAATGEVLAAPQDE